MLLLNENGKDEKTSIFTEFEGSLLSGIKVCINRRKKDETLFWKYGNNSYYTYDFIAGRVCCIFNQ